MNLASIMFWPDLDFGFVLMTNIAGNSADQALRKLSEGLYKSSSGKGAK